MLYCLQVLYYMLQGIVLVMLLFRWIIHLSFQPRLSIIPGSILLMLPDMLHYLIVVLIIIAMVAALACIVFGDRIATVSTYGSSFYIYFQFLLMGDDGGVFTVGDGGCSLWFYGGPTMFFHVVHNTNRIKQNTRTHTHARTHTRTHARTHARTHTCTHARTHAHKTPGPHLLPASVFVCTACLHTHNTQHGCVLVQSLAATCNALARAGFKSDRLTRACAQAASGQAFQPHAAGAVRDDSCVMTGVEGVGPGVLLLGGEGGLQAQPACVSEPPRGGGLGVPGSQGGLGAPGSQRIQVQHDMHEIRIRRDLQEAFRLWGWRGPGWWAAGPPAGGRSGGGGRGEGQAE